MPGLTKREKIFAEDKFDENRVHGSLSTAPSYMGKLLIFQDIAGFY